VASAALDRSARLLLVFSLLLLLTSDLVWAQMSDEEQADRRGSRTLEKH